MSKDVKKFSDPRWNDLGKPKVIGYNEIPEKEQKENKERFREYLKKSGVIKAKQ